MHRAFLMHNCVLAPKFAFAGQITEVEGYVESTAIGLLAGRMAAHDQLQSAGPAAS